VKSSVEHEAAKQHLDFIRFIHTTLTGAGVPHWLGGGWGVDFTLGRVTRVHEDVDFAVWIDDWPQIEAVLVNAGLSPKPPDLPAEARRFLGGPTDLEFWMLTYDEQGRTVVGGRWADWPFPDDAFSAPESRLEGVTCPVLSTEALLESKAEFPKQRYGRPLRERDAADIDLLRDHIARQDQHGPT
jgi:Aminoglycoside-2''-adenylyltransferase